MLSDSGQRSNVPSYLLLLAGFRRRFVLAFVPNVWRVPSAHSASPGFRPGRGIRPGCDGLGHGADGRTDGAVANLLFDCDSLVHGEAFQRANHAARECYLYARHLLLLTQPEVRFLEVL